GRAMLLASAIMAASALWTGSAGAAPIRADMSLDNGALFEQVQMRGHGGGGGGGGGAGFSRGSGSFGGGAAMSRGPSVGGGAAMSRGQAFSGGAGNFAGNRVVRGGNWGDGRRFSDGRFGRGFRGPG